MSERTRSAYDRWAATYDIDPNPQTALEYDALLAAVAPGPQDVILDAGGGTGRYTVPFVHAGATVVGVDFSLPMLAVARAKLPQIPFDLADLAAPLPFPNARFSKICCAQTLKHLPDLRPTLAEFARILRPGGLLVFSVTHPDMVWDDYEMRMTPDFILSREADIHHHDWGAYRGALDGAGFQAVAYHDLRVSEIIAALLTPTSFAKVAGRPQVLLCTARSPA